MNDERSGEKDAPRNVKTGFVLAHTVVIALGFLQFGKYLIALRSNIACLRFRYCLLG